MELDKNKVKSRFVIARHFIKGLSAPFPRPTLKIGDSNHFSIATNEISIQREKLDSDQCLPILAHECGHRHISRYPIFLPNTNIEEKKSETKSAIILTSQSFLSLMNIMEDRRAEVYMGTKYKSLRKEFLDEEMPLSASEERHNNYTLYLMEVFKGASYGFASSPYLPNQVTEILEKTKQLRMSYIFDYLPPINISDESQLPLNYEKEVMPRINPKFLSNDPQEQVVQCYALMAFDTAVKIYSFASTLIDQNNWRLPKTFGHISSDIISGVIDDQQITQDKKCNINGEYFWKEPEQSVDTIYPNKNNVDSLAKRITAILPKSSSPLIQRIHSCGNRLKIPSLIRYESSLDPNIFLSKTKIHDKPKLASFLFLIDLSGSMAECIEVTLKSIILLTDALARATEIFPDKPIEIAVEGFQDRCWSLVDFTHQLNSESRLSLSSASLEVNDRNNDKRSNNQAAFNDDGLALMDSYHRLKNRNSEIKTLIFVGDGIPQAEDGGNASCRRLIKAIELVKKEYCVNLLGLGIGKRTDGITKYFGDLGRSNISQDNFPDVIESLFIETFKKNSGWKQL